jgi:hypothetical protein
MGIANAQNMTHGIPQLPRPYGIRVRLRPGDPFAKLLGADWQKTHWYFTAIERDRALARHVAQARVLADRRPARAGVREGRKTRREPRASKRARNRRP